MIEQTLMPEDLYAADEVFITSTNRSLLGVSEIAGHPYAAAPGPVAQKLEGAFSAAMREYVAQRTASVRTYPRNGDTTGSTSKRRLSPATSSVTLSRHSE